MPQDATEEGDGNLSAKQLKTLDALLSGRTVTEAAHGGRVHRATVHRWLRDPTFLAELNSRREELRDAADARLEQLQSTALAAVEAAVDAGDARIALSVLRGMGSLSGKRAAIGPTDPDRVAKDRERQQAQRALYDDLVFPSS